MNQSLRGLVAGIADERARRDALGGTRRRGPPAPDSIPNVDPPRAKGSLAVVLSSSCGGGTVIFSAASGTDGWQFKGFTQLAGNRFVESGGQTSLGKGDNASTATVPPANPPELALIPANPLSSG